MISDGTRTQAGPPFSSRSVLRCSLFNCGESETFTVHSTQNTSSGCRSGVRTGGGFCQRKEDEVTLEDPVQEENDAKSESHVIEAFLTDGHNTKPLSCGKHLGPHGFVDAVFLQVLFDSSFGNIHDVGLGDALCRSSCGASHHCDADRFSSLCSNNRVLLIPHTHQTQPVS